MNAAVAPRWNPGVSIQLKAPIPFLPFLKKEKNNMFFNVQGLIHPGACKAAASGTPVWESLEKRAQEFRPKIHLFLSKV